MNSIRQSVVSVAVSVAAALVIVAVAIGPFLTPTWVAFEQERSQAQAWTGFTSADLRIATDAILADLVLGPPEFDVVVAGAPVLGVRERGHMRDVRTVFMMLWVAAAISAVILVLARLASRTPEDRARLWRSAGRGAMGLAVGVVVLGLVALVAFDALFEVFHQAFFPAGSYTFDPRTERLVQLFPFQFWQESAIAVGVVILVLAGVVAIMARGRGTSQATKRRADAAHVVTPPG